MNLPQTITGRGSIAPTAALVPESGVAWTPNPGGQMAFLSCPLFEVLLEGNRGGGKTETLLMDFAQHIGQGFGREWRGLLLRRTYPELSDVIEKAQKLFPGLFPGCKYNTTSHTWSFAGGEKLTFSFAMMPKDYYAYHGKAFTWIAWEELTTWPDDSLYRQFMSLMRTSCPGVPLKYRATTNPHGSGHNWVKRRWKLPLYRGRVIEDPETGKKRTAVCVQLAQNRPLLDATPDYVANIREGASSPAQLEAWLQGSWDIVAGGMFSDVWRSDIHVIPHGFDIPQGYYLDRSYDDGSAVPFAVLWWAESNGDDLILPGGKIMRTLRGDLFLFNEWYGWTTKKRNEGLGMGSHDITRGIIEREQGWGVYTRVLDGPADSSIFNLEHGTSVANDMAQPVEINGKRHAGMYWQAADKSKNSRKGGWRQLRDKLINAVPRNGRREKPGLFIADSAEQWIETVPVLPRDEKDLDEVPDGVEDHAADATRYRCHNPPRRVRVGTLKGLY